MGKDSLSLNFIRLLGLQGSQNIWNKLLIFSSCWSLPLLVEPLLKCSVFDNSGPFCTLSFGNGYTSEMFFSPAGHTAITAHPSHSEAGSIAEMLTYSILPHATLVRVKPPPLSQHSPFPIQAALPTLEGLLSYHFQSLTFENQGFHLDVERVLNTYLKQWPWDSKQISSSCKKEKKPSYLLFLITPQQKDFNECVKMPLLYIFAFSTFLICGKREFYPFHVKVQNQGKNGEIPWGFICLSLFYLKCHHTYCHSIDSKPNLVIKIPRDQVRSDDMLKDWTYKRFLEIQPCGFLRVEGHFSPGCHPGIWSFAPLS